MKCSILSAALCYNAFDLGFWNFTQWKNIYCRCATSSLHYPPWNGGILGWACLSVSPSVCLSRLILGILCLVRVSSRSVDTCPFWSTLKIAKLWVIIYKILSLKYVCMRKTVNASPVFASFQTRIQPHQSFMSIYSILEFS